MKTKKFLTMVLALVSLCLLSSCSDNIIGDYDYDWQPEVVYNLEYDLYIISQMDQSDDARLASITVNSKLNQYLDDKFNTVLNIKYVRPDEYIDTIKGINLSDESSNRGINRYFGGAIVLIAGNDVYDYLVENSMLADLKGYIDSDKFGILNAQISGNLTESAIVNENGTDRLYFIPNGHRVGEYEFTIINRDVAENILKFSSQTEIGEMHIRNGEANELAEALQEAVANNLSVCGVSSVEDVIRNECGLYEDKAKWEELGYICNVTDYPESDFDEAVLSGFGILKSKGVYNDGDLIVDVSTCEERAMEIIYAINTDSYVRNLLQYGLLDVHYTLATNKVTDEHGNSISVSYVTPIENCPYKMNLLYTGDMFMAYYCNDDIIVNGSDIGAWTYEVYCNAKNQNKEVK